MVGNRGSEMLACFSVEIASCWLVDEYSTILGCRYYCISFFSLVQRYKATRF